MWKCIIGNKIGYSDIQLFKGYVNDMMSILNFSTVVLSTSCSVRKSVILREVYGFYDNVIVMNRKNGK